ncbi:MAG: DNA repair protein RadC [Alistipes sp.]|nr:DNA repair protein RadC [Alistipes sp.]
MRNIADKLSLRGAAALSDEELVAVVIAESPSDDAAVVTARAVVAECGGRLAGVAACDLARLRMVAGLGKAKALRLKAAVEIGSRVAQSSAAAHDVIASDKDVVRIMEPLIGALQHEECWVLYLASSGRVLERMRISQGGVQSTVVDCRLIIKRALELLAVQIVIVHNHPSGTPEPSAQDITLTERVTEAAALFDIRLLDHVIISHGNHYSFRGHNLVK